MLLYMADIFTKEKRSVVMSAVKNKGSLIEKEVASALRQKKISYRSHNTTLPGKPDFTCTKIKTVIFVDSCFWHGCRYHGSMPKSNKKFWNKKITNNRNRDRRINAEYKALGWRVLRIWEHTLRNDLAKVDAALDALLAGVTIIR